MPPHSNYHQPEGEYLHKVHLLIMVFLFEDFFINRINFLLNINGFILFNTMVINKNDEARNQSYKTKFDKNYSLRMYPKVETHNELFTIKKLS